MNSMLVTIAFAIAGKLVVVGAACWAFFATDPVTPLLVAILAQLMSAEAWLDFSDLCKQDKS